MNKPLTDGVIASAITLGDFRTMTSRFPAATLIMIEAMPLFEAFPASKVQITYAAANDGGEPRVVIA